MCGARMAAGGVAAATCDPRTGPKGVRAACAAAAALRRPSQECFTQCLECPVWSGIGEELKANQNSTYLSTQLTHTDLAPIHMYAYTTSVRDITDIDTSGRGGPERKAEATQRDLVVLGSWLPSAACTHTVSTSYNLRLLDTLVVRLFTCMYVVPRGPCESRDVCRIRHKRYECRIGAGDAATSSFDNRYCSTTETFPIRTSHACARIQPSIYM